MLEEIKKRFEKKYPTRDSKLGEWTIWDKTPSPQMILEFLEEAYKLGVEEGKKKVADKIPTMRGELGYWKPEHYEYYIKKVEDFKTNLKKL